MVLGIPTKKVVLALGPFPSLCSLVVNRFRLKDFQMGAAERDQRSSTQLEVVLRVVPVVQWLSARRTISNWYQLVCFFASTRDHTGSVPLFRVLLTCCQISSISSSLNGATSGILGRVPQEANFRRQSLYLLLKHKFSTSDTTFSFLCNPSTR